jgi:hypothetical protein
MMPDVDLGLFTQPGLRRDTLLAGAAFIYH